MTRSAVHPVAAGALTDRLGEARKRTLALVAGLSDAEAEAQHTPLLSPLCWDLAHIAAYEDLWIGHRLGGLRLLRADLARTYDAFETPRAVRGSLPLLGRAEALGDLPTSKPLRTWLHDLGDDAEQVAFDPERAWQDPAEAVGTLLAADPRPTLDGIDPGPRDGAWLDAWRRADRAAADGIAEALAEQPALSEPNVVSELGAQLPSEATLLVASSMPVRDVETFFAVREDDHPPRVLANRGANGIDGTTSTAFGAAAASDGPVALLTGDVTLLHDLGGLLAARRLGRHLTIVLLDNDGGGIFHFLPVSGAGAAFEEHVATPHGIDFAQVAALFGCRYERPEDPAAFRAALAAALAADATTLLHVRTDREANVAHHRDVWTTVERRLRASGF